MDLDAVKGVKALYDATPESEDKTRLDAFAVQVRAALEKDLPALTETDRAAVAWYISEVVATLRHLSVASISDSLSFTVEAYAIATVDLLGWRDQ